MRSCRSSACSSPIRWPLWQRDLEPITDKNLARLSRIALDDLEDLFKRKPDTGRLYRDRLLCIALCQGAALHYVDGRNGVKDFDVWSFFSAAAERPFPYRRLFNQDSARRSSVAIPLTPTDSRGAAST